MSMATPGGRDLERRAEAQRRFVAAIAHPLRNRLLIRLHEGVASPKQLAAELGEPIGRVSHHIRTLRRIGAIELVRTEQRRGAVEHFYRAPAGAYFSDDDWARLPIADRRAIFGQQLQHIGGDVATALASDGFDHPRAWVAFLWLGLDEHGMAEMSELLSETLERAIEIKARNAERGQAEEGGDRRLATELVLLHFERPR